VLIHEAVNDAEPRAWPGFRNDYSHYRQPWQDPEFHWGYRMLMGLSGAFAYREWRLDPEFADHVPSARVPIGPYAFDGKAFPASTAYPFRRNVRTILELAQARGGRSALVTMPYDLARSGPGMAVFRVALDEHNAILRELAREQSATLVDLDALAREGHEASRPFFLDVVHMTPEGNRWKAMRIARALLEGGLL
jgi:hypothetical protein